MTTRTIALARAHGLSIDETIARDDARKIQSSLEDWRERVLQTKGVPGDSDTVAEILVGLGAEHVAPDAATDAMARFIRLQQYPDGMWKALGNRPPLEGSDIQTTAQSLRSLQMFASAADRSAADEAVRRGVAALRAAQARSTADAAFQILGLAWGRADRALVLAAAKPLIAAQRPDGGWAQRPSMESDAFATGQTLIALHESGAVAVSDAVYARGVTFLIAAQLADGSWFVRTRAIRIQPHFESGFPHGKNQFISAAATNWATQALIYAAR
ncbi:MAG: hypothetical protein ACRD1V_00640 [Vicinamibacterales bacterium]